MPEKEKKARKWKHGVESMTGLLTQDKYFLSLCFKESALKRYFTTDALLIISIGKNTQQTGTELRHLLISGEDDSDLKCVILAKLIWENHCHSSERFQKLV